MIFSRTGISLLPALAAIAVCALAAGEAGAQSGVAISPAIIAETAKARDIYNYQINITNNTERQAELYAVVKDMAADGGIASSSAEADRSVSLRKWISITHGVIKLAPGESTAKDLEVKVSPYALPGKRWATITFVDAPNRYDAEKRAFGGGFGQVLLSFTIEENIVEKAGISRFASARNAYLRPPVRFETLISNFGNRELKPAGMIYITDRRGRLVAEIPADTGGAIPAGEEAGGEHVWDSPAGIGKYKARLEIRYGQDGQESADIIYFWYLPWPALAGFIAVLACLVAVLLLILLKKSPSSERLSAPRPRTEEAGVINLRGKNG